MADTLQNDALRDGIERCQCGRPLTEIHCPSCASCNFVALPSKAIVTTDADGNPATLRVWRCRKCGTAFNEYQWKYQCTAPFNPRFAGLSTAKQRRVRETPKERQDKIISSGLPDELMEHVRKMQQERGIDPDAPEE